MRIFIDGRRNGYSSEQCGKTFTVKELIEFLEGFDPDAELYLINDRGYTYGNIDEYSFEEDNNEEEEY